MRAERAGGDPESAEHRSQDTRESHPRDDKA
jgi:hypothetical protein